MKYTKYKSIMAIWLVLCGLHLFISTTPVIAAIECYQCHGTTNDKDYRPLDAAYRNITTGGFQGSHRQHMAPPATPSACAPCHPGSDKYNTAHRDRMIKVSGKINNSPLLTKYSNTTSAFTQRPNPVFGACTNVNCHFESETPQWGVSPLVAPAHCNTCHGAPPNDGSHGKKHGDYFGNNTNSCGKCHPDHMAEANPFAHATSASKRSLQVQFITKPNSGGSYLGTISYPNYLPSQSPARDGGCSNVYCHSDALGRAPNTPPRWSATTTTQCDSCHSGRSGDFKNMTSNGHGRLVGKLWIRKYPCTYCHAATVVSVTSIAGKPPLDGGIITTIHVNGKKDIQINPFWKIDGERKSYPDPVYNEETKTCDNLYCHSDGTVDPDKVKFLPWTTRGTECNSCHGHERGKCSDCHDGKTLFNGKLLSVRTDWAPGEEWKSAMPMFPNEGANKPRANSHPRHLETSFSCDKCHSQTITAGGECSICHTGAIGSGMSEASHLNPAFHVNKVRDVSFSDGGTYNYLSTGVKSCSNTKCHTGDDPVWGASVTNEIICISCHGTYTNPDLDDFGNFNNIKAQINLNQWKDRGHGRTADKGNYLGSDNPPAKFPGNPCWYCHDNNVLHKDGKNPYRLKMHSQFSNRFEKECVYCHMNENDQECMACHNDPESLAPQLKAIFSAITARWPDGTLTPSGRPDHTAMTSGGTSCLTVDCHYINPATPTQDLKVHNTASGFWTTFQKWDVRNQYMMMGVCLQCHDDDGNDKCAGCHGTKDSNGNFLRDANGKIIIPAKYGLGFDPGTGFIKPVKARASSVHFGHKHYDNFIKSGGWGTNGKVVGTWKGGKFCWDCHDPHGDSNIYMIHDKVATETDGVFGIPVPDKRAPVKFTQKNTGDDYVKNSGTIDGICNVCHTTGSQHYRSDGGDGHNGSYVCTKCHEHRFSDSHAGTGNACGTCHKNKPIPRHSGFGLPRDCTKCHAGNVGSRVDIMGQFKGNSHHVQGVATDNKHCYACHWESTPEGLIDNRYHEGYNYKTYTSAKNAKVDLVLYGPKVRPSAYREYSTAAGRATAVQFTANKLISTDINVERKESAKITNVCISCHSDQNNDTVPFNDCKTPRQYAWDRQSIAARYSQTGSTRWGKYSSTTVTNKYKITKAFSAHGNAAVNQGGWNATTGVDSNIPNSRAGFANMSAARKNVQCFDCHNSHGSKVAGVTSSYVNYSGTKNGGNLKEVTAGKGGYEVTYFAKGKANGPSVVNPYNPGAGQCFDCHMTPNKGTKEKGGTPWGYSDTFGATAPIKGYKDGLRFGLRTSSYRLPNSMKASKSIVGGHLKAATTLSRQAMGTIDGLCTPCHDPHGVSPTLGSIKQNYAVPLLKDTWLSSPYKEDFPAPDPSGAHSTATSWGHPGSSIPTGERPPSNNPVSSYYLDRNTFGATTRITENDTLFAGLCTRCHTKNALLGNYTGAAGSATGANKAPWKSMERIHGAVKGWGNNSEHANPCSKCHQPHNSALPRLMQTNCLDYQHRGNRLSGGQAMSSLKAMTNAGIAYLRDAGCSTSASQTRGYPIASVLGTGYNDASKEAVVSCHVSRFKDTVPAIRDFKVKGPSSPLPTQWPDENYWNRVTPWPPKP